MGGACCGAVSQVPFYVKDLHPECHNLTPRTVPDTVTEFMVFDHKIDIMPYMACHIETIVVHMGKYIVGIEVSYLLDGKVTKFSHIGKEIAMKKRVIEFHADEHIDSLSCAYDDNGISELAVKTTSGRFEIFDSQTQCTRRHQVDLKEENKAIIAFKGKYLNNLTELEAYACKIINYPDEPNNDDRGRDE